MKGTGVPRCGSSAVYSPVRYPTNVAQGEHTWVSFLKSLVLRYFGIAFHDAIFKVLAHEFVLLHENHNYR